MCAQQAKTTLCLYGGGDYKSPPSKTQGCQNVDEGSDRSDIQKSVRKKNGVSILFLIGE
jgi:hypothetical protein